MPGPARPARARSIRSIAAAPRTLAGGHRPRVHDQRRCGDTEKAQAGHQPHGLTSRHLGGPRDDDESRDRRILQHRLELADRSGHRHELGGELPGTHEIAVLQQHAQQQLHPRARGVGHLEQSEGVTGGRGVDHDSPVSCPAPRPPTKHRTARRSQAARGPSARRCRGPRLSLEPKASEDLLKRRSTLARRARARAAASSSRTCRFGGPPLTGRGSSPTGAPSDVAQRVCRIGGQQQHACVRRRRGRAPGRRRRRPWSSRRRPCRQRRSSSCLANHVRQRSEARRPRTRREQLCAAARRGAARLPTEQPRSLARAARSAATPLGSRGSSAINLHHAPLPDSRRRCAPAHRAHRRAAGRRSGTVVPAARPDSRSALPPPSRPLAAPQGRPDFRPATALRQEHPVRTPRARRRAATLPSRPPGRRAAR